MHSVTLRLKDAEATLQLGRVLAQCAAKHSPVPALLLQGDLGSGKTTLVRGAVESLPGAENAEVSSPSFNIFNVYPTTPQAAHFDLYRLEGMPPDEELHEFIADPETLVIVEWIQYLTAEDWPDQAVHLVWHPTPEGREVTLSPIGDAGRAVLAKAAPLLATYKMD